MILGLIGGTGFYDFDFFRQAEEMLVPTAYGDVYLRKAEVKKHTLYILLRHGREHTVLPHLINYRANICALKTMGVQNILALCAVGAVDYLLKPGDLVLVNQFLDFSWGREHTFAENAAGNHTDMSFPYCQALSAVVLQAAHKLNLSVVPQGVYVCTQGPRFETPAEIQMYRLLGGTVVGMTGVPEVTLAKEAGLCYSSLAVCSNYAAGIKDVIDHSDLDITMKNSNEGIRQLILQLLDDLETKQVCNCSQLEARVCLEWRLDK